MDPAARKQVFGALTYGIYVMTAAPQSSPAVAATVTWLSQASFEPPLLMVAVRSDSRLLTAALEAKAFAINLPGKDQQDLVAAFFKAEEATPGSLSGYDFRLGSVAGAPILTAVPAWLEARVVDSLEHGDHTIVVGEMVAAGVASPEFQSLRLRDTPWKYGR